MARCVATQVAAWQSSEPAELEKIAVEPITDWFGDWNANVESALSSTVDAAAAQGTVAQLVAYDIPERDCGGYSSGSAPSSSASQHLSAADDRPRRTAARLPLKLENPNGRQNSPMPFDPQPFLQGRCLTVRPLRASDFDALYEVARDPLVWAQHPERNRHRREVFERFFTEALESGGALAVIADSDDVIGSSRFTDMTSDAASSRSAGRFSRGRTGAA